MPGPFTALGNVVHICILHGHQCATPGLNRPNSNSSLSKRILGDLLPGAGWKRWSSLVSANVALLASRKPQNTVWWTVCLPDVFGVEWRELDRLLASTLDSPGKKQLLALNLADGRRRARGYRPSKDQPSQVCRQPKDTWMKGHYSSHVSFGFIYLWLLIIYLSDDLSVVNDFLWSMYIGSTSINNVP
jgi:hypothetical protein